MHQSKYNIVINYTIYNYCIQCNGKIKKIKQNLNKTIYSNTKNGWLNKTGILFWPLLLEQVTQINFGRRVGACVVRKAKLFFVGQPSVLIFPLMEKTMFLLFLQRTNKTTNNDLSHSPCKSILYLNMRSDTTCPWQLQFSLRWIPV